MNTQKVGNLILENPAGGGNNNDPDRENKERRNDAPINFYGLRGSNNAYYDSLAESIALNCRTNYVPLT